MHSFRAHSFAAIFVVTSLSVVLSGSSAHAQPVLQAVRAIDATLAATLRNAYRASPTLRTLVDELERSDVIVHLVDMAPVPGQTDGRLFFVHAGSRRRILRMAINRRLAPPHRAALLGHELQHAVEVARAPSVVDQASFADLYEQIGYRATDRSEKACYETDAARRVAQRVLTEWRLTETLERARSGGR